MGRGIGTQGLPWMMSGWVKLKWRMWEHECDSTSGARMLRTHLSVPDTPTRPEGLQLQKQFCCGALHSRVGDKGAEDWLVVWTSLLISLPLELHWNQDGDLLTPIPPGFLAFSVSAVEPLLKAALKEM